MPRADKVKTQQVKEILDDYVEARKKAHYNNDTSVKSKTKRLVSKTRAKEVQEMLREEAIARIDSVYGET